MFELGLGANFCKASRAIQQTRTIGYDRGLRIMGWIGILSKDTQMHRQYGKDMLTVGL